MKKTLQNAWYLCLGLASIVVIFLAVSKNSENTKLPVETLGNLRRVDEPVEPEHALDFSSLDKPAVGVSEANAGPLSGESISPTGMAKGISSPVESRELTLADFAAELEFLPRIPPAGNLLPDEIPEDLEIDQTLAQLLAFPYEQGRLLVKYNEFSAVSNVSQLHYSLETHVTEYYENFGGSTLAIIDFDKGRKVEDVMYGFLKSGLVEVIEPDYIVHAIEETTIDPALLYDENSVEENGALAVPSDPSYSLLYGMSQIDAPSAWDTRTSASGVVVAVIDTGVRYTHQDLAGNMWINTAENTGTGGVDDDGNGYIDDIYGINTIINGSGDPMDDHGHGTHVAGTIGAVGNNATGVSGVAWDVQLMAVKFLASNGSGSTSNAIEGITYAINQNADIMNNSWGGGGFSTLLLNAIQSARDQGIIFVAAAGNNNTNNDSTPHYPSSYASNNVVAVGSTTSSESRSSFSNYGFKTVDVFAPGSSIYSTDFASDSSYSYKSGTSMATPMVSGVFALLKAQFPASEMDPLINRVYYTVARPISLNGLSRYGRVDLGKAIVTDLSIGTDDILMQHTNGNLLLWLMAGTDWKAAAPIRQGVNLNGWKVRALRDLSSDGDRDLLMQHTNGNLLVWQMSESSWKATFTIRKGVDLRGWTVREVNDYDNDSKPDLLMQHTGGNLLLWTMNDTAWKATYTIRKGVNLNGWTVRSGADFDGDGKSDILMQHTGGNLLLWTMNDTAWKATYTIRKGVNLNGWTVRAVTDFDADGKADILMQHTGGNLLLWTMNGTAWKGSFAIRKGVNLKGWTVRNVKDFDGDSKPDLLMQHTGGNLLLWTMNGTAWKATYTIRKGVDLSSWKVSAN